METIQLNNHASFFAIKEMKAVLLLQDARFHLLLQAGNNS
jgi:hypothetical protein